MKINYIIPFIHKLGAIDQALLFVHLFIYILTLYQDRYFYLVPHYLLFLLIFLIWTEFILHQLQYVTLEYIKL